MGVKFKTKLAASLCFFLPFRAEAIDCQKASTKIDTAICADAALLQADKALNAAFERLADHQTDEARYFLTLAQKDWLHSRPAPARDPGTLRTHLEQRTNFLVKADGLPSGQDRLMFFGVHNKKPWKGGLEIKHYFYKFISPKTKAEAAFNQAVETKARQAAHFAPTEGGPPREEAFAECSYFTMMKTPFWRGSFISAPIEESQTCGGAHGGFDMTYLNMDLEKESTLSVASLFDSKGRTDLRDKCFHDITKSDSERNLLPYAYAAEVDDPKPSVRFQKIFSNLDNWSFDKESVSINFGFYSLGSYATGTQSCRFPYKSLTTYLNSGAKLPQ